MIPTGPFAPRTRSFCSFMRSPHRLMTNVNWQREAAISSMADPRHKLLHAKKTPNSTAAEPCPSPGRSPPALPAKGQIPGESGFVDRVPPRPQGAAARQEQHQQRGTAGGPSASDASSTHTAGVGFGPDLQIWVSQWKHKFSGPTSGSGIRSSGGGARKLVFQEF